MTVESNYLIAIATLSDWLKRLPPVFQPMRSKTKTNRTMYAQFVLSEVHVITRNRDWFIAPSSPVVIGRSNCFGFGFSTQRTAEKYAKGCCNFAGGRINPLHFIKRSGAALVKNITSSNNNSMYLYMVWKSS